MPTPAENNEFLLALTTLMNETPSIRRAYLRPHVETLLSGREIPLESVEFLYGQRPLSHLNRRLGRRPIPERSELTLVEVCYNHQIEPGGPFLTTVAQLAELRGLSLTTMRQYRYLRTKIDYEFGTSGVNLGEMRNGGGVGLLWFPVDKDQIEATSRALKRPLETFDSWWDRCNRNPANLFKSSRERAAASPFTRAPRKR